MKQKIKEKLKKTKAKIKKIECEIKEEIKEDFLNVPNVITLIRMLLVFFVVYMIFNNYSRLSVAIVFGIAAATDWLDGYFARRLRQTTVIGARLDQVSDRIFTLVTVVALLIFFSIHARNQILLLFLISSREILGGVGFIIRVIRNKDAYKVRYIGKITTLVQSFTLAFIIVGFDWSIYPAIATCILGIVSGVDYIRESLN